MSEIESRILDRFIAVELKARGFALTDGAWCGVDVSIPHRAIRAALAPLAPRARRALISIQLDGRSCPKRPFEV